MDKKIYESLLNTAHEARKNSYSPYSQFAVGCAILLKDKSVITGVNIENAAYGVVLCAERSAMATIISMGKQNEIIALAVATDANPAASPCGMCRQFLSEFFSPTTPIIYGNINSNNNYIITNIQELLPQAFSKNSLI